MSTRWQDPAIRDFVTRELDLAQFEHRAMRRAIARTHLAIFSGIHEIERPYHVHGEPSHPCPDSSHNHLLTGCHWSINGGYPQ